MLNYFKNRSFYETLIVIAVTLAFGIGVGFLGALAPKFQVALGIGMFGFLVIAFVPHKRSFCLFLWVLIQPLSIEKILYTAPGLWDNFRGLEVIMNAGDLILILLAGIVIFEGTKSRRAIWVWDKKSSLFLAMVLWAIVSYLIHLLFYQSEFINTSQLGILHLVRVLLFVIIITSAIKTRSDLIWVLIAVLLILVLQSFLVCLSFVTTKVYNFGSLLGGPSFSQTYSGGTNTITRAVGTLGVANQQGLFHAMFTFLLIGFFAVKKPFFRYAALSVIVGSFIAVIFTFSRGSWLTMGLATVLIFCVFFKRREITPRSWLVGGLIMLLFSAALAAVAQPIIDRLTKGDDGATDSRIRMITLAKDLFLQYPIIGVGPSEYVEAGLKLYPPGYKTNEWTPLGDKAIVPPLGRIELARIDVPGYPTLIIPLPVHNKYMLILSELGVVGLLLWLMIFYEFYRDAKSCSKSKDPLLRFIGIAGLGIVLVAVVYMNLDLFADDKTLQILLFPLLVITAANRVAIKQARDY
ncbi:O-antigen ligase [Methylotenera sp.]|uniref:O-antigen ligase family protein n=1 Tax=Methylotenera sp. TaxID=2051956 RepID=UPI00248A3B92|nr:O-antigen ligase family protein [Methylotenera sp.]MDI1297796.1 O-antigen ligase family protein [Methylotenera sp.]